MSVDDSSTPAQSDQTTSVDPQTPPAQVPTTNQAGGDTGTSNPPDGGAVSSVAPPPQEDGAGNVKTGSLDPSNPDSTPSDVQNPAVAAPGSVAKATASPAKPAAYTPQPDKPPSKFLGALMTSAKYLSGLNNATTSKYNPVTGAVETTAAHPSMGQILATLAIHAVQGIAAGAGAHGPNAIGEAAQAGLEQGEKSSQQVLAANATSLKNADEERTSQLQSVEANMRMLQLQQSMARQDEEQFQNLEKLHAPMIQSIKDQNPDDVPVEHVTEDMVHSPSFHKNYPITEFYPLVDGYIAQTDGNGNQEYKDIHGNISTEQTPGSRKAWQATYAMIKRTAPMSMKDGDGDLHDWASEAETGGIYPKGTSEVANSATVSGPGAAVTSTKVATQQIFQADATRWNDTLTRADGGTPGQPAASTVPDPNKTPAWNYTTHDLVQAAAQNEGKTNPDGSPSPAARFHNPTNLKATPQQMADHSVDFDPKTGFRIFKTDEEGTAAAEADVEYKRAHHPDWTISQLSDTWTNGDPNAAKNYATSLTKMTAGSGQPGQTPAGQPLPDVQQFARENKGFDNAIFQFENGMKDSAQKNKGVPNIGDAISSMKSKSGAQLMYKFFGGTERVRALVNQQETDQKVQDTVATAKGKDALEQAAYKERMHWLTVPQGYVPSDHPEIMTMGPTQAREFLAS